MKSGWSAVGLAVLLLTRYSVASGPNSPLHALAQTKQPVQWNRHHPRLIYGKIPLLFEKNQGQASAQVKFMARGNGYSLFLTPKETVFAFHKAEADKSPRQHKSSARTQQAVLRMRLVGAGSRIQPKGQEPSGSKANYFRGSDPRKWHRSVPTYGKVRYSGVYPGIDLLYYGNQRQLEYDFVIAPKADVGKIGLDFGGAKRLHIDKTGALVVRLRGGDVLWHRPVCYQEVNGKRQIVAGNYVLRGRRQVGFQLAKYDRTKPLVIDPVFVYSTYLGGTGDDYGLAIAVDAAGNAYVTGRTNSSDFPVTANAFQTTYGGGADVFISKISADGSKLLYSTYLSGIPNNSNGIYHDGAYAIAVDAAGNAYVTGRTNSSDFPVTANAFQKHSSGNLDAFVSKISADGSQLVYSTYLGGTGNEIGQGIAVDAAGDAYVTGNTSSTDFPVTANAFQTTSSRVFISKLSANGSKLLYSTYLGGSGADSGKSIAVDAAGNIYVAGTTTSSDFPVTARALQKTYSGAQDAFITKLSADGSKLLYSTYLGGKRNNYVSGFAVDTAGNTYVAGYTSSTDFPVTANAFQTTSGGGADVFVSKLSADGSKLLYSTYLGGSSDEEGNGIAVDAAGNAYVTGNTYSTDFPVTANAFQTTLGGYQNAFLTKLSADGSKLLYSTYLGGTSNPYGNGFALDTAGNAYMMGDSGGGFAVTANAFQQTFGGSTDVALSRIRFYTRFDLNGDDQPDILLQNQTTGALTAWLMSNTKIHSVKAVSSSLSADRKVVAAADFNGDDQTDLLVQSQSTGAITCLLMNGLNVSSQVMVRPSLDTAWKVVAVADMDGDGHPDILLQNQNTGEIACWLMNGFRRSNMVILATSLNANIKLVGVADFNGDGQPDLLLEYQDTGEIVCWLMNGVHAVKQVVVRRSLDTAWKVVGVADIDGDGHPDIILQNQATGRVVVWLMNGLQRSDQVILVLSLDLNLKVVGLR